MIDKRERALVSFWSSFGLSVYDETSVPDTAEMPYMTCEIATAAFDKPIPLSLSLWYYSSSWEKITAKAREIIETIGTHKSVRYNGGGMNITIPSQDYTRMNDSASDMIRRIVINVMVEFVN